MKKTVTIALLATLALALGGFTSLARAQATTDATSQSSQNKLLKGTFSFLSDANDDGFNPSVGTFTFDGMGGLTGIMNINADGVVCAGMTLSGTYVVNSNNSATAALTLTSVATSNCNNLGNNDTLALAISFGVKPVSFIHFAEMDQFVAGVFQENFDTFAGEATLH